MAPGRVAIHRRIDIKLFPIECLYEHFVTILMCTAFVHCFILREAANTIDN